MSLRRLVLCADDYGHSPGVDAAVLLLLAAGRLTAVSAFTLSPRWAQAGRELIVHRQQADLGVHFNLTHPFTSAARPLAYWLARSRLPGLPHDLLLAEFLRQIDAFAQTMGCLPDFIDGHQHVHAFPGVREALLAAIAARWSGPARPYVRAPDALAAAGDSRFKAGVLKFACSGMAARLQAAGLASPAWFAGVYSLHASVDYPGLMRSWLAHCPDRGLVMCHPGLDGMHERDPIGAAREREYAYLASDAFFADCAAAGVRLGRYT